MGMPGKRILVLDDSEIILKRTAMILGEAGYEVTTETSPFGMAALIDDIQPHLILLDVNMPALNGDQALGFLKKRGATQDARVLFFSDEPEAKLQALADQAGADGFIRKTGDEVGLVREVERWLQ